MMFRSLFLVAPFLAAGEVCEAGKACAASEHMAMLQVRGRDETKELLHRSSADLGQQTLRTLEENLMGKNGADTAMCTYYMKSRHGNESLSPCETLGVLERTFHESLKDFMEFDQIMQGTMHKVMDSMMAGALFEGSDAATNETNETNATMGEALLDAETAFTFGITAEGQEFVKLTTAIRNALEELGGSQTRTEMAAELDTLFAGARDTFTETVHAVEEDIKKVMKGETITLPDGATFSVATLLEHLATGSRRAFGEAIGMLVQYINERFATAMNLVGQHVSKFWRVVLHFPEGAEDPFAGLEWSKPRDMKKMEQLFWHIARGYLDLAEHIESVCKSEGFQLKKAKAFAPRKICKDKDPPLCVDEFLYVAAVGGEDAHEICKTASKYRSDKALQKQCPDPSVAEEACKPAQFIHSEGACKSVKDLRKACKIITKYEAWKAKQAAKQARQ